MFHRHTGVAVPFAHYTGHPAAVVFPSLTKVGAQGTLDSVMRVKEIASRAEAWSHGSSIHWQ